MNVGTIDLKKLDTELREEVAKQLKSPVQLKAVLLERAKVHGDFAWTATHAQRLKTVMHETEGWARLSDPQREALELLTLKMARILAGDPNYRDHWFDIAGYAQLVADRL